MVNHCFGSNYLHLLKKAHPFVVFSSSSLFLKERERLKNN